MQSGSSISLTFPITRIDDISAIESVKIGSPYGSVEKATVVGDAIWAYGKKGEFKVSVQDLMEIKSRGTMYDLEFLFRALMGKKWTTVYRGQTADIGLGFSMPMRLVLSNRMVYRVRMSGIQYSHKSFTKDMVPMYTDVSLSFDRIPDVKGY